MTICLCGNIELKEKFIKSIKEIYDDKILICDLFYIKFNVIIDTEKIKYKLLDECNSLENARLEYQNIVDNITNKKIDKIINENKEKIILLIDKNILTNWFIHSSYFIKSDIKILFEDLIDDVNYNKDVFDYVVKDFKDINIRKLVKV